MTGWDHAQITLYGFRYLPDPAMAAGRLIWPNRHINYNVSSDPGATGLGD